MQVHASTPWCIEYGLRENAAVSDHERDVGIHRRDELRKFWRANFRWLFDTQTKRESLLLHGRSAQFETSTCRSIGLANNEGDLRDRHEGFE